MNVRIVVPLTWESPLRSVLLTVLMGMGYTWSRGDSLSSDYEKLHNMAYIAIPIDGHGLTFSSNLSIIDKFESKCGYNYVVVDPTLDRVISSINFVRKFLEETNSDEYKLKWFLECHHDLKDKIKLLS